MPLVGSPVARREDQRLLTGGAQFIANLDLPGAACVTYVVSPVAHAVIRSIDTDAARQVPGVLDVVTAADVDIGPVPPLSPAFPDAMARPLLAGDRVRFAGEAVVAIVSETEAAGEDAAELVDVDYDPLPAVTDVDTATSGEVMLFPEAGTNVVTTRDGSAGDAGAELATCEVVVSADLVNQRLAPCPLEGRAAAARWGDDGRLVHWSACQGPHPVRDMLARVHGLEPEQVRVIAPDVGGSFGAKARPHPEEVLLPWLARRTGRPVRWLPPRSTDMVGLGHSRAQRQHVEIGGDRDGTVRALRVRIDGDAGAYPVVGPLLAANTAVMSPGAYRIRHVEWSIRALVTNTTPVVAYRGAGRPEAAALIERAVDLFAAELGRDPVEVRRHNLVRRGDFPYDGATGVRHDSGDYHAALDLALDAVGYEDLRAEQARRRGAPDRRLLGVGLATFIDRTAGIPGSEYGAVELRSDGTLLVRTGSSPYGQGHHTAWAMLVADRTGLPLDRIEVVHGDTDVVPRGGITGGSRSAQKAGSAVAEATDALVERARDAAAELLEAAATDVVLDLAEGRFHVAGAPAARTVGWAELAADRAARGDGPEDDHVERALRCETDFEGEGPTVPFGAYVAVVEVDRDTGAVELQRMVTVDDAGTIVNPVLALGQIHGGVAQGIGQALFEEFRYDADGNPLTTNFADYAFLSAAELPQFECRLVETPSPNNPLGVKGIAESGTIGAPPAVQNAVLDAVAHLGVRHLDLPLTPERVWRA
ncbi:MAG TPA: xanthine dehydrogenase family protein molybdopterin-binding subunit, partial [Acidimicrobiales bacterium]|nr:xanthine dehydrogenase family protein molybdopterin-binding subunit [Acidimicrobiales bacterium]